jgi:hypothetical protein
MAVMDIQGRGSKTFRDGGRWGPATAWPGGPGAASAWPGATHEILPTRRRAAVIPAGGPYLASPAATTATSAASAALSAISR